VCFIGKMDSCLYCMDCCQKMLAQCALLVKCMTALIASSHRHSGGRAARQPYRRDRPAAGRDDAARLEDDCILQGCSFSLINVGSGFHCLRNFSFLSFFKVGPFRHTLHT
jgi:hypothetical protein